MAPPTADSTKDVDKKPSQRKMNKPLIEKRRRARINDCLSQLKTIVLSASESKSPRPSKLEKADILEMTVEFVKSRLCSNNEEKGSTDSNSEYLAGYSKCLNEISKFLEHTRPMNSSLKQDIVDHVSEKLKGQLPCPEKMDLEATSIPVLPNIIARPDSVTSDEAIDLRLHTNEQIEKEPLHESKPNTEQTQQPITVPGVQNATTPMGLVCGGQVMLLVQFPQTMQPPVTSYPINQSQTISSTMTSYPISQTHNLSHAPVLYPSSQSQNMLPLFGVQTLPRVSPSTPEVLDTNARVIVAGSDTKASPIRDEQNNVQDESHWRPW